MIKNQQQPVPAVSNHDGKTLQVHSIFRTIQGEGPFSGRIAIFVRLAECNLQCPLCDTQYTGGSEMSVDDIINQYVELKVPDQNTICVITGGEPLRQNITPMCREFAGNGIFSQVETNGSIVTNVADYDELVENEFVTIVCSPKTRKIHPFVAKSVDAYKYVVHADDIASDGLPIRALENHVAKGYTIARPPTSWCGPIYVHPVDVQDPIENSYHRQAAVRSVMDHKEPQGRYRILGAQIHKDFGLA